MIYNIIYASSRCEMAIAVYLAPLSCVLRTSDSSESSEGSSEACVEAASNAPFSGPFGRSDLPQSVRALEAAMKEIFDSNS